MGLFLQPQVRWLDLVLFFSVQSGGSDAVVVWFISNVSPHVVPFKASVAHCQGERRATLFMLCEILEI